MIQIKPSKAILFILSCISANRPAFIWGKPAIGKSAIVRAIAKKLKANLIDVRALLYDPTEVRVGFVVSTETGDVKLGPPAFFNLLVEGQLNVIFLDELNAAAQMTQAAFYQLVLDRRVGELELPDNVVIVAAGNYEGDKAVTHRMPTPLRSRFIHCNMVADLEDWLVWAPTAGVRSEVSAFLRFKPALFDDFNPDAQTFPGPRTWEFVSQLLDTDPPEEIRHALFAGAVDEGAAGEFVAFLRQFERLPDIDEILRNPMKVSVPKQDNLGTLYALASALSRRAKPDNFANVLKYLGRMPAEYTVFAVKDAIRRDGKLAAVKEYGQWAIQNHAMVI